MGENSLGEGILGAINKTVALLFIGVCVIFSLSSQAFSQDGKIAQVLVLNSYNKGFPWVDGIVEAVESGLNAEKLHYQLRVEYMDTKVTPYTAAYKKKLYELYSLKYATYKFDAIVASDDNAFNFLREYSQELFPETPIVFCAVNNTNAANLIDHNYFTGVLETPDQESMINLALRLHPGIKKIYFIADTTTPGNYRWEKQTVPLISTYPNIEFTRIDDSLSLPQIEDKMSNLPDDAISFYAVLTRDKTGRLFSLKEAVSRISKASRTPIYTFLGQDLKYGLIGGNVMEGYRQGELASHLVLRILKGENTVDIPVEEKPTSQFKFSYPQLQRFNINVSDLPEDSIIINKPDSFYMQNKHVFWIASGAFTFLLTVVVLLAFNTIRSRKAELHQRESEAKWRLLFSKSPVGICTADLLGNIVMTNLAYEQMLGYSKEELKGLSFFDVTHPDHRPRNRELFQKMFSLDSNGFKMEKLYVRKDGGIIDVSVNATAVRDDKGNPIFGTAFIEDITEHKKAEKEQEKLKDQLTQAQKMESIGNLAGGIAHEFNNMLAIIMGNNELIIEELPQGSLARESTEEIRIAGLRARDVVKQLLTFSRHGDAIQKVMDLYFTVQESMKLIRSSTPTNIKIEQNLSTDTYPIMGNDTQINQLLINLCNNGVDALPEKGGLITIELFNETIDIQQTRHQINLRPGQYAKLMVSDNGSGMDAEVLERIFDPYFTTKDIGEGTGIGMAVVHGIVKRHGGEIIVDSTLGRGTTFTVFLPAHAGLLEQKNDEVEVLPVGDEYILYVDDEPSIATLGKRLLNSLGYTTESTTEPEKALDILRSNPSKFDLLITDMAMPNITGDQLVIETLKIRPDMPTIICTGYSAKISEKDAANIGASSYVMKPINKSELAKVVRKVLDEAKGADFIKL